MERNSGYARDAGDILGVKIHVVYPLVKAEWGVGT